MKSENIIHVKLEYPEALQTKRDILFSEMSFLKIEKIINNYKVLRLEELKLREELYKKIRATKTNIGRLQRVLPKIKIPEILKKEEKEEKKKKKSKGKKQEEIPDLNLEDQLKEIQKKLNDLQKQGI
jgi:hypothetical protein